MPGGNEGLVHALAENVPISFEKTVYDICYCRDSVKVITAEKLFEGDMALCIVPLGVLKSGSITFIPRVASTKAGHNKKIRFWTVKKRCIVIPVCVLELQCQIKFPLP